MKNKFPPIIFCHYGCSDYLCYVLNQARYSNPNTRIVLLGDDSNKSIAVKASVEHRCFDNYANTKEINTFNEVYKHVAGRNHGRKKWTNFVFKRWFYIYSFLKEQGINDFWHFDSDNMILDNLNAHSYKFDSYDCTEQCGSSCLNGYVSGINVVFGYLKTINSLFLNDQYIAEQESNLINYPTFAFTEMRAYTVYRDKNSIRSTRLNKIINAETFDDCICFEDGYVQYKFQIDNRSLKQIYFNNKGEIFFKNTKDDQYVRVVTLNLSWVPIKIFEIVTQIVKGNYQNSVKYTPNNDGIYMLDLTQLSKNNNYLLNFCKFLTPRTFRSKIRKYYKRIRKI